jgi:hypothetical protein
MGWRDILRKYGPAILTTIIETALGKSDPVPVQPAPVAPLPAGPVPVAPLPAGPVPMPDLVGKWKGTLDKMSMEYLGHLMAEDELYNNAILMENQDVPGVVKNLMEKRGK